MSENFEYRVMNGNISVPYHWTAGEIYGRFLAGLKEKRILGFRCRGCNRLYVPPGDICSVCFLVFKYEDQVALPDAGKVTAFTVIRENLWPQRPDPAEVEKAIAPTSLLEYPLLWPPDPPYALVAIRFEGADTDFLHLVKGEENLSRLKVGVRVRAVWREEREGYLLDLDHFELETEENV